MNKFAATLFLAFVFVFSLSVNIFAEEGQIPIGGRTCPPNTTCLVETQPTQQAEETTVLKTVLDYLTQLFG